MKIRFEISSYRLENGRTERDTISELELEIEMSKVTNPDIENIKVLICQLLDKLKRK
jgi:hypothetical protein